MRFGNEIKVTVFLVVLFVFSGGALSWAAGPILVDTVVTGNAVVWQDGQVRYDPESSDAGVGGGLGRLDNSEARQLVRELFDAWADVTLFNGTTHVSTVSLTVTEEAGLGDIDSSNLDDHFSYCPPSESCTDSDPPFVLGSARSGQSPLLFDQDGTMTDLVLGVGASSTVLGFAGPRVVAREGSDLFIKEAQAVLNGRFIDCASDAAADDPCQGPEVSVDAFKAVVFHELGHFLGLDHSQVNLDSISAALAGDVDSQEDVATMSPLFIGSAQLTPHYDDKVAISTLYPSSVFLSDFCTISGTVFRSDETTPIQGVNVIARRVDNPTREATSFVSGALFVGETDCTEEVGDFLLRGILPGVSYSLEIEKISSSFQSGSSIEPCDPPLNDFTNELAVGTFSCSSGGQTIAVGSQSSTDFVTTKEAENILSTGCTLKPSRNSGAKLWKNEDLAMAPGLTFLFLNALLLCVRVILGCRYYSPHK